VSSSAQFANRDSGRRKLIAWEKEWISKEWISGSQGNDHPSLKLLLAQQVITMEYLPLSTLR
jgi:hypothetical protein